MAAGPVLPPLPSEVGAGEHRRRPLRALPAAVATVTLLLVAAVALLALSYRDASRRADRNAAHAATLESELGAARVDLGAARRDARAQFGAGRAAGLALATNPDRLRFGYPRGYEDGYQAAFAGFAHWQPGWYLVQIEAGKLGPTIVSRTDVPPCRQVYVQADQPFSTGNGCTSK